MLPREKFDKLTRGNCFWGSSNPIMFCNSWQTECQCRLLHVSPWGTCSERSRLHARNLVHVAATYAPHMRGAKFIRRIGDRYPRSFPRPRPVCRALGERLLIQYSIIDYFESESCLPRPATKIRSPSKLFRPAALPRQHALRHSKGMAIERTENYGSTMCETAKSEDHHGEVTYTTLALIYLLN